MVKGILCILLLALLNRLSRILLNYTLGNIQQLGKIKHIGRKI